MRELLGYGQREIHVAAGATLESVWNDLVAQTPELLELRHALRFARNGAIAPPSSIVHDGDEIALLPPVGGG